MFDLLTLKISSLNFKYTKPAGTVDYDALVKDAAWNTFLIDCLELNLVRVTVSHDTF